MVVRGRVVVLLAVCLAACRAEALPPVVVVVPRVAPPAPLPQRAAEAAVEGVRPARVRWSRIQTKIDGCYFFSGPDQLGREDHLGSAATWERQGSALVVTFLPRADVSPPPAARSRDNRFDPGELGRPAGAPPLVFSARGSGDHFDLVRHSHHEGDGSWKVIETIRGEANGARFEGSYSYEECEVRAEECPGHCRIDAHVVIDIVE